ncbi:MAG: aminotransferase class V-fold PLP-dependent enzyme [Methylohalobius sp.]|nr:aminotransferase class V-fold PLP-dependent enzyme [Methylohalobius sp.]
MAGRNHLYVPGPTNVPDSVLSAMHLPMEDHRSPEFPKLVQPLFEDLKRVFRTTTGRVFIFPATGTAGWEIAMVNTLSPGDKVLSYRFGHFSHLWIQSAKRLGLEVEYYEVPWGQGVPLDHLAERLRRDQNRQIKALLICHNETSTGVTNDLKAIRQILDETEHPALFMIDGVSSIGSLEFRMDEWGVDVALTGSQKGFMLPAGGAYVGFSPKALAARHSAKLPRSFFSIDDQIAHNDAGYFPYTPNTAMLHGLRQVLNLLLAEGMDQVYARHRRLAEGVRRAVLDGWGMRLCAQDPKWYSDTVSAIVVPEGFDARDVIRIAYYRYNLSLGSGLSELAGKVFRIGHLGDVNELMLASAIVGAEMAMRDVGIPVQPGSGIAAAMEYWRATASEAPER